MSTGTNIERITQNNTIIDNNNDDLIAFKNRIDNLPDTSTATAQAKDIMQGKTAYANGLKVTGTNDNPDWSEIGCSSTPQYILDGFDYAKEIYDNWDMSITNLSGKYNGDTNLVIFPSVDMSNITNMDSTFRSCTFLREINLINTNNVSRMLATFIYCTFEKINAFNTSNVTWMGNLFRGNTYLKDLPVLDTSNVDNQGLITFVTGCTNLSDESLNNIMRMCIMQVKARTDKTLKYIGLTSTQATRCQSLSNWNAFVEAGWSTGY